MFCRSFYYQLGAGLLTLSLGLAGCSSPSILSNSRVPVRSMSAQSPSNPALYPIEEGLTWHYVLRSQQNGQPGPERPMHMRIAQAESDTEGRVAVLERFYKDLALPPTRVTARGDRIILSRLADPPPPTGPSLKILELPPILGASWTGRPLPAGNEEKVQVLGWEEAAVPAGSFRVLHVVHRLSYSNGESDSLHYWYAAGTGCVRMIETVTVYLGGTPHKLSAEGQLLRVENQAERPPKHPRASAQKLDQFAPGLMPVASLASEGRF